MPKSAVAAVLILPSALIGYASTLSERAASELDHVIRPPEANGGLHWNTHSEWFTYPPSLPFAPVEGASSYRISVIDDVGGRWTLVSSRPDEPLTNVWPKMATGYFDVCCRAFDAKGAAVGGVQANRWWKLAPFRPGAYPAAARSYAESAAKIYEYVFNMPATRRFLRTGRPDPEYQLNSYPTKMHSGLIKAMVRYAKAVPAHAEDAMKVARNAADYLISISEGEGRPLAGFPPTYEANEEYRKCKAGKYAGQTMLTYPQEAGSAYLELYEASGEAKYLSAARAIADRYLALQGADGTWPLKLYLKDGSPVVPNRCLPLDIIGFLESLNDVTKDDRYRAAADRAYAYVENGPVRNWNWEGQFEDVDPTARYHNLTEHPACSTAIYLLKRFPGDAEKLALARELVRFAEDQFVCWERPCHADGSGIRTGDPRYDQGSSVQRYLSWLVFPCVTEQYNWNIPVDASCSKVIRTYLALYRATKDPLDLAKAKALGDALTRAQQPEGRIPTQMAEYNRVDPGEDWTNCMIWGAVALEELAAAE